MSFSWLSHKNNGRRPDIEAPPSTATTDSTPQHPPTTRPETAASDTSTDSSENSFHLSNKFPFVVWKKPEGVAKAHEHFAQKAAHYEIGSKAFPQHIKQELKKDLIELHSDGEARLAIWVDKVEYEKTLASDEVLKGVVAQRVVEWLKADQAKEHPYVRSEKAWFQAMVDNLNPHGSFEARIYRQVESDHGTGVGFECVYIPQLSFDTNSKAPAFHANMGRAHDGAGAGDASFPRSLFSRRKERGGDETLKELRRRRKIRLGKSKQQPVEGAYDPYAESDMSE